MAALNLAARSVADDEGCRELLAMLYRRAGFAQAVGEIKRKQGAIVFRPERAYV